jgi:hypothetical protein
MNSELSVNVSFHAIIARLTLLQVVEVLSHVQGMISLESGLELSTFESSSDGALDSSHFAFNSSICFK